MKIKNNCWKVDFINYWKNFDFPFIDSEKFLWEIGKCPYVCLTNNGCFSDHWFNLVEICINYSIILFNCKWWKSLFHYSNETLIHLDMIWRNIFYYRKFCWQNNSNWNIKWAICHAVEFSSRHSALLMLYSSI